MKLILHTFIYLLALHSTAFAQIVGRNVSYSTGNTVMQGYIAYDDSVTGKRPGILVVHEWWGYNDYARKRADMLAALGYTAMALDMYGDGQTAHHPSDASTMMMSVKSNMQVERDRFGAALETLKRQPTVDAEQIAAIGYCFGGTVVLDMARIGTPLRGVVSFHGALDTNMPAQREQIKAKILVFNGDADPFIPRTQVATFKAEMQAAQANYRYIGYSGVLHSFTNPDADSYAKQFNMPLAYDAFADKDSWQKMQDFFKRIFAVS